jgi:hypothetical protein
MTRMATQRIVLDNRRAIEQTIVAWMRQAHA